MRVDAPQARFITSDGPMANTPYTAIAARKESATVALGVDWGPVKKRTIRVILPGLVVNCWIRGGTHMATRATRPSPAHVLAHRPLTDRSLPSRLVRRPDRRRAGSAPSARSAPSACTRRLRPRRLRSAMITQTSAEATKKTTTMTAAEKSVCTIKEPISTAPSNDSGDPAGAAAQRTANSTIGKMTTVGFHGLTARPTPTRST